MATVLAAYPTGPVAPVRSGVARRRARRGPPGGWAARRNGLPLRQSGRHPLARRRLPRLWSGQRAVRARLRRSAARLRRAEDDEPALRGREHAVAHGSQGRSSVADARVGRRGLRAADRRGARRRLRRPPATDDVRVDRCGRQGSPGPSRDFARRRWRVSASRRARARARDEPGARQRRRDGHLWTGDRSRRTGSGGLDGRPGDGHGRRQGGCSW